MLGAIRYGQGLLHAERGLLVAFLALLLWAPLPLGSDRQWAASLLCMGLSTLLALTWALVVLRGQSPVRRCQAARWPLLLLGLFLLIPLAQLRGGVPDPEATAPLLFTRDAYQTQYFLLCSLSYVFGFVLVLLLVTSERRARLMLFTVVAGALLQAVLSIVLLSAKAQYMAFFEPIAHGAQTTGTFVNRNHLACYLYLGLSMGIGWMLAGLTGETRVRNAKQALVGFLRFLLTPRMVLRLLLVLMVVALVLTRSRMGNGAFMTGLMALAALLWWRMPHMRKLAAAVIVSLLVVDVLVVGQWVGLERVVQRMEQTAVAEDDRQGEETLEARLQPARRALPMLAQHPWFGQGGGTFYTAFTPYKTPDMVMQTWFFDHAHNDYVELAADVGLAGLALLLGVVVLSVRRAVQHTAAHASTVTRGVAYGVFMATVCLALHSMVDFNLQIPANALTYITLLGLLWASPWGSKRSPRSPVSKRKPVSP